MEDGIRAGEAFEGRYVIERELARGGMGIVYLAQDNRMLSRRVVIKVLKDSGEGDWTRVKFRQEMEALSRIEHPGVVGILDAGEAAGKPYLVMQFIEGETLRHYVRPEGMDFERFADWIRQIGAALQAAHDKGVLHRDLKPENIMIVRGSDMHEQVKIIDFGLAKVRNSQTGHSTGVPTVVGSYGYISPEQLLAQPLTPATDVYALGIVCFELLAGRRPFQPDSVFQLLDMQRAGVRVKPRDLRPAIPEPAEAVLLKALSLEPSKRQQSTVEFCDSLANALLSSAETMLLAPEPAAAPAKEGSRTPAFVLAALNSLLLAVAVKNTFFRFTDWYAPASLWLLVVAALGALPLFLPARRSRRLSAALLLLLVPAAFAMSSVVTVAVQNRPISPDGFTLNYSDTKGHKYTLVDASHGSIRIDPGRFNRLSGYRIELRLSPDLEFADVYLDSAFGVRDQLSLQPSSTNDILWITRTSDDFRKARTILFTYKYRTPPKNAAITVTLQAGKSEFTATRNISR